MTKCMQGLLMIAVFLGLAAWIGGLFGWPGDQTRRRPAHELADRNAMRPPGTAPIREPAEQRTNLASRIGSDCAMDRMTPTGITADYAREIASAIAKNDSANGAALIQGGHVIVIQESVRGRVLDSDWTKDALKIRVLGGSSGGRELWVHHALCR